MTYSYKVLSYEYSNTFLIQLKKEKVQNIMKNRNRVNTFDE